MVDQSVRNHKGEYSNLEGLETAVVLTGVLPPLCARWPGLMRDGALWKGLLLPSWGFLQGMQLSTQYQVASYFKGTS